MSEELQTVEADPSIEAVKSLPADLAVLRIENESIMSLAAARPRDYETIKRDLQRCLDAFPAMSATAIYSKPVGKDNAGKQTFARGLSVRAAEALAEAYGFCRVRSDATMIDEHTCKIEATFVDFQRGRIWQDGSCVSRWYKTRNGQMAATPIDRFLNVVVKAEKAKLVREVIVRSVNAGLKAWFWDACEKMLSKAMDQPMMERVFAYFSGKGVSQEQLEEFIGRPVKSGWTKDDARHLGEIKNAIESGEATIAEVFEKKPSAPPTGPVSGADLANPQRANGDGEQAAQPAAVPTAAAQSDW